MSWNTVPVWAEDFARSILESLRIRDPYTAGHCIRVGFYSKLLAKAAGLHEYEQRLVEFSGIFHDIGKIGISETILQKPGRLTAEEEKIMQEHPLKSVQIIQPLAHIPFFRATLPGIRHHHERIDGLGYPDRLSADRIPLVARIILIADTYDAMTSDRVYRKGLTDQIAYDELIKFAGRQFDEQLVKVFLNAHPAWKIEHEKEIENRTVANLFREAA